MNIGILAECYLNECIAREILKRIDIRGKLTHKKYYGRDRVLKEAKALIKRGQIDKALLVIDYEEGVNRLYLEKTLSSRDSVYEDKVIVGKDNSGRIIAVIFDPHPEDVLGIHNSRSKSREACRVIKQKGIQSKLENILGKLVEVLKKNL